MLGKNWFKNFFFFGGGGWGDGHGLAADFHGVGKMSDDSYFQHCESIWI